MVTEGTYTIFSYSIERLFARVKNRTATRVKMLKGDDGKANYEEMALTDQERADFDILCPRAATVVFRMIQALSHEVEDAFSYGQGSSSDEITYSCDLPLYWDPNITPVMDNQIETVLEYWITKEWYRQIGLVQLLLETEQAYNEAASDLRGSVVNRRKRVARKYRIM
jgi:hypothetical protein